MRVIDADKFLAYLIYSGLIDDAKCGDIAKAVEQCEAQAIPLERVEQIRTKVLAISFSYDEEDINKIFDEALKEQE